MNLQEQLEYPVQKVSQSLKPAKNILTIESASKIFSSINNLEDFAAYARLHLHDAAEFWMTKQFYDILRKNQSELLDIYEHLGKSFDTEKAMDIFLILAGLKRPVKIIAKQKKFVIKIDPIKKELYQGEIPVQVIGWGYLDDIIQIKKNSVWLKITSKFTNGDVIKFSVDPLLLPARYNREELLITDDTVSIFVVKKSYLKLKLLKELFVPGDTGKIFLENNTGNDLVVEVSSSENFVRFEANKYYISEHSSIPFNIKLSAMQSLSLKKQPLLSAVISVCAIIKDKRISHTVKIFVGDQF